MRGSNKSFKPGDLNKGQEAGTALAFELDYLKLMVDGQVQLEMDKWNNVFLVDGVDYLAEVREAI